MIEKRKISRYVLLQIFTLGIYGTFKFWPKWTKDLNKICKSDGQESASYLLIFLLDIFTLGIYSFVWNYQTAERMYRIAPEYGIELKRGGSFVLMLRTVLFFLPVVGSVERIKAFNALAVAYNALNAEEPIVVEAMKDKKSKKDSAETENAVSETNVVLPSAEVIETSIDLTDVSDEVASQEISTENIVETYAEDEIFEIPNVDNLVNTSETVSADSFVETTFKPEDVVDISVTNEVVAEVSKSSTEKEKILEDVAKSAGTTKKTTKKSTTEKKTKTTEKTTKSTKTAKAAKDDVAKDDAKPKTTKKAAAKTEEKSTKKTASKSAAKPKTTKAAKEKAKKEVEKLADEVKIDDAILESVSFDEISLEAELLNDIEKANK